MMHLVPMRRVVVSVRMYRLCNYPTDLDPILYGGGGTLIVVHTLHQIVLR